MKKILLLSGLLLALSATVASAYGVNLAWNTCGGPDTKTFLCNTNTGTANTMVCSAVLPHDMDKWAAFESTVELQSDGAALPDWWKMKNVGTCRSAISVLTAAATAFGGACEDPYMLAGLGGIGAYNIGYNGANRARILVGEAIPAGSEQLLIVGPEYGACTITISNAKSTGLGKCAGCEIGVCLVLTQVVGRQPAGLGDYTLTNASTRNWIKWQAPSQGSCDGATASKKSTWGSVKSLYR